MHIRNEADIHDEKKQRKRIIRKKIRKTNEDISNYHLILQIRPTSAAEICELQYLIKTLFNSLHTKNVINPFYINLYIWLVHKHLFIVKSIHCVMLKHFCSVSFIC